MTAPLRYQPCGNCRGDGCPACEGAGFFPVGPGVPAPRKLPTPTASRTGRYLLCIARDGWAKDDAGFCYPRWCLAASADGKRPAFRYRNGGPEHLVPTTAAKVAPAWMLRLVAEVREPLPLAELADMAAAWKAARGMPLPKKY